MSTFAFLVLGAIVGGLARKILPDRIGGGLLKAVILGVIGALVGGWLSLAVLQIPLGTFWSLRTWVIAIAGSVLVLFVYGLVTGKPKNKR